MVRKKGTAWGGKLVILQIDELQKNVSAYDASDQLIMIIL